MKLPQRKLVSPVRVRLLSTSRPRLEIRSVEELPDRLQPGYEETKGHDLLSLKWPSAPRNILLVKKENTTSTTEAVLEFANYVHRTYPNISFIFESTVASSLHSYLPFPIYTTLNPETSPSSPLLPRKVDLTATFGGDGTVLRASALFSTSSAVPPILSFSMGTLGFLNEWEMHEYKRAFRELYVSGSFPGLHDILSPTPNIRSPHKPAPSWSSELGASLGTKRAARILLRNRLRVSLHNETHPLSKAIEKDQEKAPTREHQPLHALNELILHRGASPHLLHLHISLYDPPSATGSLSKPPHLLTTAVADGLIISTPTGSTAYNLSTGGSIMHPLVKGMIVTPISPRSLSFRPLVLPAGATVGLRLAEKNRAEECEVSVDGVRREGLGVGGEVRVWGEEVGRIADLSPGEDQMGWTGGVPCVMRGSGGKRASGDEGWVDGLNGLLKFNFPFGEEEG